MIQLTLGQSLVVISSVAAAWLMIRAGAANRRLEVEVRRAVRSAGGRARRGSARAGTLPAASLISSRRALRRWRLRADHGPGHDQDRASCVLGDLVKTLLRTALERPPRRACQHDHRGVNLVRDVDDALPGRRADLGSGLGSKACAPGMVRADARAVSASAALPPRTPERAAKALRGSRPPSQAARRPGRWQHAGRATAAATIARLGRRSRRSDQNRGIGHLGLLVGSASSVTKRA
jgi:hypothetical protein